ncbi:MAG: hypothetical protein KAR24_03285 [Candidatus Pacebacteria bacterium]|nr:hypothetical protein [Candidatus Paceibacterota bacterium]
MTNTTLLTKTIIGAGAIVLGLGAVASASAFGGGNFRADITDGQKAIFEEARELRMDGNDEEARALLTDNDLGKGFGTQDQGVRNEDYRAERMIQTQGRHDARVAGREVIENNDYEAFVAVQSDNSAISEMSEETFLSIGAAHELREAGDTKGARAIMEDLGFPMRQGNGYGQGSGGYEGNMGQKGGRDNGIGMQRVGQR